MIRAVYDSFLRFGIAVNAFTLWTRLRAIRTVSTVELDFPVFSQDEFQYQRIAPEAERMRRLGMSFRAIGDALGVDDKQVRKALRVR